MVSRITIKGFCVRFRQITVQVYLRIRFNWINSNLPTTSLHPKKGEFIMLRHNEVVISQRPY